MYFVCALTENLNEAKEFFDSLQEAADYALECSEDDTGCGIGVFDEDGDACYAIAYAGDLYTC